MAQPSLLEFPALRLSNVATKVVDLIKEVSNNRYNKVVRGHLNWSDFPFDRYPWGAAVIVDQATLLRRRNTATLTIELMTQLAMSVDEVNDDLMDKMRSDAVVVWSKLNDLTRIGTTQLDPTDDGLPVLYRVDNTSDAVMEMSDVSEKIQGISATVTIEF